MGDSWFADNFPEFEGKLVGLPRRFDFLAETFESDQFIQANLSVSRKLFSELLTKGLTGFFINDLRTLLPSDNEAVVDQADPASTPVSETRNKMVSHGRMFVPMPNSGSVFVFKTISKVTNDTKQSIVELVDDQLQFLNAHLESPVHVRMMLIFKQDSPRHKKLFCSIETEVKHFVESLSSINVDFKFCVDEKLDVKDFDCAPNSPDAVTKLMKKVLDSDRLTQNYTLSPRLYKHFAGESFSFSEHEKAISMFKVYFPDFDKKLGMIPDCNRINENLLYSTNEKAMFKKGEGESKYLGEVKWFLDKCIPMLEPMTGVLIKNWDHRFFNSILSSDAQFSQDFEFDYLWCSKDNLVVFEVAATQSPESPDSAVRNKLDQVITKILPTLKVVTATILEKVPDIWFTSPDDKRMKIQNFIRDNLKVFVYLPNATLHGFQSVIKNNNDIREFMKKFESSIEVSQSLNQIYFVMHEHEKRGVNLLAFKLSSNLKIAVVGDPRLVLYDGPEKSENLQLYLFALIAFSNLNCNNALSPSERLPLDVDERYNADSQSKPNLLDLILSPQQEFILNSEGSQPRLWLRGEPGSGKTALLLAKAIQAARSLEITCVFYAIPSKMYLLRSSIEKELNKKNFPTSQGNVEWKHKLQILSFDDYNHLHRQVLDCYRSSSCQLLPRDENATGSAQTVALFIDEVYVVNGKTAEEINKFDELAKIVWVAEIVTNDFQINWAKKISNFKVVNLTLLYRNSHHISQTASSLVNSRGVTESTAVVHGCHTSSQKKIAVEFYENEEVLSEVANRVLDSRFGDDRLFIYFSTLSEGPELSVLCRKGKLDGLVKNDTLSICGSETRDKLPFGGCERQSVALVIDENCEGILEEIIILAITRAQYEVAVLINKQFPQIDRILSYLRSVMPPYLRIYADSKSGSKYTDPEPLAAEDLGNVVYNLIDHLNEDQWSNFIQSRPRERRDCDGVNFVNQEDIMLEIVKEPRVTLQLVQRLITLCGKKSTVKLALVLAEKILLREQVDGKFLSELTSCGEAGTVKAVLEVLAEYKRLQKQIDRGFVSELIIRGESGTVNTVLGVLAENNLLAEQINRGFASELNNRAEAGTVKAVLEGLAEYKLLQKHFDRGFVSELISRGEAGTVKTVLEVLAENNLLKEQIDGEFVSELISRREVDTFKTVFEILAENNVLEEHIKRGLVTEVLRRGEAGTVKAVMEVLAEYKLLQKQFDRGCVFELISRGESDTVKTLLEVLAENNLLAEQINRGFASELINPGDASTAESVMAAVSVFDENIDRGFVSELISRGESGTVKTVLEVLAENNLLKEQIDGEFVSELISCGEAGTVKAVLKVVVENNLFEQIERGLVSQVLRRGEAVTVKAVSEILAESKLLKKQIDRGFVSEPISRGEASIVKAVLEVLAEHKLLQKHFDRGFVFELISRREADTVKTVFEILAENNFLEEQIKRGLVTQVLRRGEAGTVKAVWEVLAEYNLLEEQIVRGLVSEKTSREEASTVKAVLEVLAEYKLLQKHFDRGFVSELINRGEAGTVKTVLEVLVENNLLAEQINRRFVSELINPGDASTAKSFMAGLSLFDKKIDRGYVSELISRGESGTVKTVLEVLAENNLLKEQIDGEFVSELISCGEAGTVKAVVKVVVENNLFEQIERGLVTQVLRRGEAGTVKAVLEVLAEYNLLEEQIVRGFVSEKTSREEASTVKAVLEILAEYKLLQKHFDRGFVSELISSGEEATVKAVMEVLAENNLLEELL